MMASVIHISSEPMQLIDKIQDPIQMEMDIWRLREHVNDLSLYHDGCYGWVSWGDQPGK